LRGQRSSNGPATRCADLDLVDVGGLARVDDLDGGSTRAEEITRPSGEEKSSSLAKPSTSR
jgi:hypothetical protein